MPKLDPPFRADQVAAQYMPVENMGISPQCGFSSTSHGNNITMDDQWKKLELAVKIGNNIWSK